MLIYDEFGMIIFFLLYSGRFWVNGWGTISSGSPYKSIRTSLCYWYFSWSECLYLYMMNLEWSFFYCTVVDFGTTAEIQFHLDRHTTQSGLLYAIDNLPHHTDYGILTKPAPAVDLMNSNVLIPVSSNKWPV